MNKLVMDAIFSGLAALVSSFFNTASKKGLAITVLVLAIAGLVWFVFEIENRRRDDVTRLEVKINKAQSELDTCNAQRMEQAVKIARLEVKILFLDKKK